MCIVSELKTQTIRWGILGTGWIAGDFATALAEIPDARLQAVGSRSKDKAELFGGRFNIPNRHSSYESLVSDPDIDVIHIATPHPFHKEHALLALEHGKAVLCEKPFTMNAVEAKAIIDCARVNGVFAMEAMWGRFTPGQAKVRELLAQSAVGDVLSFSGHFGASKEYDLSNRFFNLTLGGGALLDVGIYPLSLMFMVLGVPNSVQSVARIGPSGVDESFAASFGYANGKIATVSGTIRTKTPREAVIAGSEGYIKVSSPLTFAPEVSLHRHGEDPQFYDTSYKGWGFIFEAKETMRCLRENLGESPLLPLDETRAIMQTMDTMRAQWTLHYPCENGG